MSWWRKLFPKKESKPEQSLREYKFELSQADCVGDLYKYTVQADSKAEAFEKLVRYFLEYMGNEVKQEHRTVVYPYKSEHYSIGLPDWFVTYLNGGARDVRGRPLPELNKRHQEALKAYCIEHGIKFRHD